MKGKEKISYNRLLQIAKQIAFGYYCCDSDNYKYFIDNVLMLSNAEKETIGILDIEKAEIRHSIEEYELILYTVEQIRSLTGDLLLQKKWDYDALDEIFMRNPGFGHREGNIIYIEANTFAYIQEGCPNTIDDAINEFKSIIKDLYEKLGE